MNQKQNKYTFSVVIPVYNEEGSVKKLIEEINSVFENWGEDCEIIVVDDGSTDSTAREVKKTNAKLIIFDKNYGQSSALNEGINEAQGDFIVTMDGDGQNDPDDIPAMFHKMMEEKIDLICGERRDRKSKKSIKIGAQIAAKIRRIALDDRITDSGCTLKIFKKDAAKSLNLFRGMHRFIPALLKLDGYNVGEIKVNHRPRTSGQTKYNWLKYFPGALGLLTVLQIRIDKKINFISLPYLFFLVLIIISIIFNLTGEVNKGLNIILSLSILFLFWLGKVIDEETAKHYSYNPKYKIKEVIN